MKAPGTPKGMRDFGPEIMQKRGFILNTIKKVFEKYGFQALETPAMENLSVLLGKYGDEGDQLLYRVLNSGDFLHKKGQMIVTPEDLKGGEKQIAPKISEKGLRYDLTVPFARFVASNYNELPIPFKRYQIQPVWRADRPQKGRYREFYQCDADFVGTDSLLCEAEIFNMIQEVFDLLGISDYDIHFNNRKLLDQIASKIGAENRTSFFTIMDKLDKIGEDGVLKEFGVMGYSEDQLKMVSELIKINGDNKSVIKTLKGFLGKDESKGLKEIEDLLNLHTNLGGEESKTKFSPTLARGLGYYTGTILEVKVNNVQIGSVSGGGRYDDLTGIFGLPNVSGVGFSFGVDRLYDVLEELDAFPKTVSQGTTILIAHFDDKSFSKGLEVLTDLRNAGIRTEIFPEQTKLKKQLQFADKKNIPFSIIIGDNEIRTSKWQLRDMLSGEQESMSTEEVINRFKVND